MSDLIELPSFHHMGKFEKGIFESIIIQIPRL